jgi:hypothetical protein
LPPRLRDQSLFRLNPTFGNPAFASACTRVLILRLSPWRDVASSSPHLFLAQQVHRALPQAYIDFAFLPLPEDRRALQAAKLPLALGVQSRCGIAAFDLVLVSNSFTLEAINLPALLLDAGLAPWADERPADAPVIILGGSNALASHCLVRPDGVGVADALFFGEAEDALVPFLQAWQGAAGAAKSDRLRQAAGDGIWITGSWPDRKHPVRQAVAHVGEGRTRAGANACALQAAIPSPAGYPLLDGESADTLRLQVAYGCPAFCAFCFEGFERKPYRELAADALLAQARALKIASGARCVELDAYTLNSHAESARLIAGLSRLFERVSFKSQRVDILAAQPALVSLELAVGKRSFTLGIEGISKRLRAFLNKSITDDEIDRALQSLLTRAVREIKLFYLITGHETAADLAAFGAFVRQIGQQIYGARLSTRLVFSFGYLVRMPNTPLRYDRLFLERAPLEAIAQQLEQMCRRSNFEFRLAASWSDYLVTQILAAGDYRLAPVVVALAREGWLYDGTSSVDYARRMQESLAAAGVWDDAFSREKPVQHGFPFDFVTTAVTPKFLRQQYDSACVSRDTGYCLGDTCLVCGACRNKAGRQALTNRSRAPEISEATVVEVDALVRSKQRLPALYCRVRLGACFARSSAVWTSARLLQLLLARLPDEADNLLSAEEALFTAPDNRDRFPIPAGETVMALKAWDTQRLAAKIARALAVPGVCAEADDAVSGLALLEVLPAFTPGRFGTATWQMTSAAESSVAEAAMAGWMKSSHLPYTLRRVGGGAAFDLAPAALRKGSVRAASCRREAGGCRVEVTFTPKVDLFALLRALPLLVENEGVVCLNIQGLEQATGR